MDLGWLNPAGAPVLPARCAVLLGVLAAQRVFELSLSRRHLQRMQAVSGANGGAHPRAAGSRGDWWSMIAVHTGLIFLPAIEVAYLGARAGDTLFWSATCVYGLAQCLRYWSIASLGASWNARAVVDSRQPCVASGPYRWIRHPNYLAVLVEFSAVPLALGAWRSWILLNLMHAPILMRRIRAEERLLAEIPGYAAEMQSKGRFFPRVRRIKIGRA